MFRQQNPIIHHRSSYYEIVTDGQVSDKRLSQYIQNDPEYALQFFAAADVDEYQWRGLLADLPLTATNGSNGLYQELAGHLLTGRLKLYQLPSLSDATLTSVSHGKGWCFVPSISNTHHGRDVYQQQNFTSLLEAKTFIDAIDFTAQSMQQTLKASDIAVDVAASQGGDIAFIRYGKAQLAASMAAGETTSYLVESRPMRAASAQQNLSSSELAPVNNASLKPVPLAPETSALSASALAAAQAAKAGQEDKVLECQVTKFSVKDKEGRSAIVAPDSVGELEFEVVSAYEGDKVEQITAVIDGHAICGEHGNSSSQLSPLADAHLSNPIQKSFNQVIYKVNSHKVNPLLSNLWLLNIEPKRYTLTPQGCNNFSPNKIHILAYPHIKWEGNFGFDFGGKEQQKEQGSIKGIVSDIETHKTSVYSKEVKWYGDLSCTIDDGKPQKFLSEYEKKSKEVLDTFSQIKGNIDGVLNTLKEGSTTTLDIGWPNLSVGYSAEFVEDLSARGVGVDYHINFKAKPLFSIGASIDIYKGLLNATRGHPLSEVLLQMEKGIGSDKTLASAQVKAELVLSLKSDISLIFDAAGNTLNDDKKKTVDTDLGIAIQLEGKLEAKGHVWVISVAAGAKVGIKSGWIGKLQVVKDDSGVYLQKGFFFNGLVVYYSYYIRTEKKVKHESRNSGLLALVAKSKPIYESSDNYEWIPQDKGIGSEQDISLNERKKVYFIET